MYSGRWSVLTPPLGATDAVRSQDPKWGGAVGSDAALDDAPAGPPTLFVDRLANVTLPDTTQADRSAPKRSQPGDLVDSLTVRYCSTQASSDRTGLGTLVCEKPSW